MQWKFCTNGDRSLVFELDNQCVVGNVHDKSNTSAKYLKDILDENQEIQIHAVTFEFDEDTDEPKEVSRVEFSDKEILDRLLGIVEIK